MNAKNNTHINQLNTEVEKLNHDLEVDHYQFVENEVIILADGLADKNLPQEEDASIEQYITPIIGKYLSFKTKIAQKLHSGVQQLLGAICIQTINKKIEITDNLITEKKNEIKDLKNEKARIFVDVDLHVSNTITIIRIILFSGDSFWNIAAFIHFGDALILAIIIGLFIGLVQMFAVELSVLNIKEITQKKKRLFYSILAAIGFLISSFVFAVIRYWFIHSGTGSNIPYFALSPFTFIIINLLFITASALLVNFYFPSKETIKKLFRIAKIKKEIDKANNELKLLQLQKNTLLEEREMMADLRAKTIDGAKTLFQKVDTFYKYSVGIFQHENILKRNDGKRPLCFRNSIPPLPNDSNETILFN